MLEADATSYTEYTPLYLSSCVTLTPPPWFSTLQPLRLPDSKPKVVEAEKTGRNPPKKTHIVVKNKNLNQIIIFIILTLRKQPSPLYPVRISREIGCILK